MKKFVRHLCLFLSFAVLTIGHDADAGTGDSSGTAINQTPKAIPLSGRVLETMDGGGYTYVRLEAGVDKIWVAIPLMKASVGQELTLSPGYEMKNFNSKGLKRKFDRLYFSSGVVNQELKLSPSALKMAHEGVPINSPNAATPAPQAKALKIDTMPSGCIERIAKAKGRNSYTIAQLYEKKTKLEKKTVVVKGRVVKVSSRILKRNWVHIQDGSGTDAKQNNNLIITSKDLPKVGALVIAKGILYNNLDFGSGYRYGLLVDAASLK